MRQLEFIWWKNLKTIVNSYFIGCLRRPRLMWDLKPETWNKCVVSSWNDEHFLIIVRVLYILLIKIPLVCGKLYKRVLLVYEFSFREIISRVKVSFYILRFVCEINRLRLFSIEILKRKYIFQYFRQIMLLRVKCVWNPKNVWSSHQLVSM